jgi:hypothetical protein
MNGALPPVSKKKRKAIIEINDPPIPPSLRGAKTDKLKLQRKKS